MNRFMGRDYVTVMGRQVGDHVEYAETSVGRGRVKSVVARVTRLPDTRLKVFGAARTEGTPLKGVDVSIDKGLWQPTRAGMTPRSHRITTFICPMSLSETNPVPVES